MHPTRKILNFHHQLGNSALTLLSNLMTGLNLSDMETGYKAFRADILKTIPLRSNRFGIEPEITAKIAKRRCTIFEVPISYNGRSYGEGKKITWRDGLAAIYTILKYHLIDDCYYRDSIVETYNDIERTHHAQEQLVLRLLPYFGDRVLELGSGIGSISRIIPVREKMTVSDWRAEYLDRLQKGFSNKDRIGLINLDIRNLRDDQELNGKFDTVTYLHQLQFCEEEALVMKNIFKLLQNKGRLLLSVPGGGEMGSYEFGMRYKRRYNRETIKSLLSSSGFCVLNCFEVNFPAFLIWKAVIRKRNLDHLPIIWAKISDTLVRHTGFIEKYFGLGGLTIVCIAEKSSSSG